MLKLREYQNRVINSLSSYFKACVKHNDVDLAFYESTKDTFGTGIPYNHIKELKGLPYVCLRVPTGGGKTLLSCHSISVTQQYLLRSEKSIVLWLVPSNPIKEQTLNALKDPTHPYRQALESTLGNVEVYDILEALFVKRAVLDSSTTIIVSTVQAFRVEDTQGRKVYETSGALMEHFSGVPHELLETLEKNEEGVFKKSLANVLKLRRPIVLVDEAHNARTSLSFDTLARFIPSCIIEFTATPDTEKNPSNVLHSISAAELKAEEMIKNPIILETRTDWKELLSYAIAQRDKLDAIAKRERTDTQEYIRPIMLIQAQPNRKDRESITADIVQKYLLEEANISKDEIAIETGDKRELEGIDVLDPDVKIKYVITVQALREGWDCPFAYVLCSITDMSSTTAIEQLLGRIMRLPKAKMKTRGELNKAYAFVTANFHTAARALTEALIQNGFKKQEAKEFIKKTSAVQGELDLDDVNEQDYEEEDVSILLDSYIVSLPEKPNLEILPVNIANKISYDKETGSLQFIGTMEATEKYALQKCFSSERAKELVEKIYYKSNNISLEIGTPSEQGFKFCIPALAIKQGDLFEILEETHFLDYSWKLTDFDCTLSDAEYVSNLNSGQRGEITVSDKGEVETTFISNLHQQLMVFDIDGSWKISDLVLWLDRNISHQDISSNDMCVFLTRIIRWLIDERIFHLRDLVTDKYRLLESLKGKIDKCRLQAREKSFQTLLFSEFEDSIIVTPEINFSFDSNKYPYNTYYSGPYNFNKHFYPKIGELKNGTEEFECAQFLDSLPEVKFWVRNLTNRSTSFWLQTSSDKFYPDFLCQLNDGRYLVVEYKGEDRWSNDDSKEKRDIGALWEAKSNGTCLFIMPKGKDYKNGIMSKIVQKKTT